MNLYEHILLGALCVAVVAGVIAFCVFVAVLAKTAIADLRGDDHGRH